MTECLGRTYRFLAQPCSLHARATRPYAASSSWLEPTPPAYRPKPTQVYTAAAYPRPSLPTLGQKRLPTGAHRGLRPRVKRGRVSCRFQRSNSILFYTLTVSCPEIWYKTIHW